MTNYLTSVSQTWYINKPDCIIMVFCCYITLACVKTLRNILFHLFVQFEVIWLCGESHEAEESAELLSASGVLKLQAELQGLQGLLLLPIN